MPRRITKACVKRLALCRQGKNGLTTLYKSDGTAEFATMTKSDTDKGQLLAVMWPKGLEDSDGDFSDTDEAIASMTSSLILNGGTLDIEHEGEPLTPEQARLTEVFSIQKSDTRFHNWKDYEGNVHDVTGGAAVMLQIDDPLLRQAHRDGLFDGVSLFGPAAVEQVDLKAASKRVAARMGGTSENDMTPEELKAALAAQKTEIADLVKSVVAEVLADKKPKAEAEADGDGEGNTKDTKPEQPTFTGDPMDPEALAAYENSLRLFELQKSIASGDITADKIAEMRKALTETGPTVEDLVADGIPAKVGDTANERKLQIQLFKARKSSNAPERTNTGTEGESAEALLAKAELDEGMAIAGLMNGMLGNAAPTMHVVAKG